jgi:signal transduction histidine kinase
MSGLARTTGTPQSSRPSHPVRTRLVTRLLAALAAVLVVSFVASFVVESNLSRGTLRSQSEEVLRGQLNLAQDAIFQRSDTIDKELRSQRAKIQNLIGSGLATERDQLVGYLSDVHSRQNFTIISVYGLRPETDLLVTGPPVLRPPAALFRDVEAQWTTRVVPVENGGFALVGSQQTVSRNPDDDLMLVVGYLFDRGFAYSLRDAAAGTDIVLFVDGEVVASTLPDVTPETFDAEFGPNLETPIGTQVVDVGDGRYWMRYGNVASPGGDGWGHKASVAVLAPEPLAALDAQLLRNRLAAGIGLLLLATLLAWLVSRRLTTPLRQLTATASDIAAGNLDASFTATTTDEVGTLAHALEAMRRGMSSQLDLIRRQADALQRAARRVVGAQDEARRRLAGDLHDGVQQQMVMLRLHLGFAKERIRQDPESVDEVMNELASEADAILGRLRETAQGIYPAILRDRGLPGALFSLAGRARSPIEVTIVPESFPRFPVELEANAYFLIAEATTNAIKHANATRVAVRLEQHDHQLEVIVRDDGQGFDPATTLPGTGLANLHDRVRALGGQIEIRTEPGAGTTLVARLPVPSVAPLEIEEHGRDAPVEVHVLAQSELPEDRVDVLLDGAFGDDQIPGDGGVPLAGGHHGEDLELSRGESRQT